MQPLQHISTHLNTMQHTATHYNPYASFRVSVCKMTQIERESRYALHLFDIYSLRCDSTSHFASHYILYVEYYLILHISPLDMIEYFILHSFCMRESHFALHLTD